MALKSLFSPIKVGNLELKNRIIMAPMGTGYANPDGTVSQRLIDYFVERAKGGAGLLTTGIAYVHPSGRVMVSGLGVSDDSHVPALRRLVEAVHAGGAKISLQVGHGGRYSPSRVLGAQAVAPSALYSKVTREIPRELTTEEVEELVIAFAEGARRAKQAGFDAIEMAACSGYLISQFLSPSTNKRSDKYGGDFNRRLTFLTEILAQTRERVGADFPISCKLSVHEYVPGGNTVEDTKLMAPRLVEAGATIIHAWTGWREARVPTIQMSVPRGAWVFLAEAIKKVVSVPVVAVGRINDPVLADLVIKEGKADLVAFGRGLLADPELPRKAAEGRLEDIRMCIACNRCFDSQADGRQMSCSVNAALGREAEYEIKHARKRRKVLVVGGGPAGMEVARVAALRGHDVTIWERDTALGGALTLAAVPPHKEEINNLKNYLTTQLKKLNVKVELNRQASAEAVIDSGADVVVVATGASHIIPNILGVERDNVVTASDVLGGKSKVGERVVVIGGGLVGCETAEFLRVKGMDVSIAEMLPRIGHDIGLSVRYSIIDRLRDLNIKMLTNTKAVAISHSGLVVEQNGEQKTLEADEVVLAVGLRPRTELAGQLQGKVAELHAIGDCVEAKRILEAVHAGSAVGREI